MVMPMRALYSKELAAQVPSGENGGKSQGKSRKTRTEY